MVTKRQKQVLDFIRRYIDKNDYAPSLEEIKRHLQLSSVSTAHYHVQSLQDMGYLRKEENQPRALDVFTSQKLVQIPLSGKISAGMPIDPVEVKETVAVPREQLPRSGEFYALRVVGNSMVDENIHDGDLIIVKRQAVAENGQKVVALINDREATLKKYYKERGHIRLQPANKSMGPIIIRSGDIRIQGIVIDVIKNESKIAQKVQKVEREVVKYDRLPLNKIICGDAVEELKKIMDETVDLVVTSPPYDGIRTYNGHDKFDLHATGKELYRVLKDGGIVVMVIQDQTVNFGRTLTSFKTITDWCDNIGFKLFECVIYRKYGPEGAWWQKRFRVDHEYMPIFLKGERPRYFNKEPLKIPSKHGGKVMTGSGNRRTDGLTNPTVRRAINPTKCRGTVWDYLMAGDKDPIKRKHPAPFPDQIPYDFIRCFCSPNGIVLDPFIGCGSTAVAAKKLGRNYIGIDISREYCELAKKRLLLTHQELFPEAR